MKYREKRNCFVMRKKRLVYNTISSIMFQIVSICCGFVIPRLILENYGSMTNGLVNSITQFLNVIAFLDLGVGAVVQSALYKPLAEHDNDNLDSIMTAARKFFQRLALILVVYLVILFIIYPLFVNDKWGFFYIDTLIFCIAINQFSQYFFGMPDQLLLLADQKGYVQYNIKSFSLLLNVFLCYVLITLNMGIHAVKLVASITYVLRPLFLRIYVNKHYKINRRKKYSVEPLKQKWNGMAQHVAAVVLDSTDVLILTMFSSLENVSIYSVYYLVVYGIRQMIVTMMNGIQALWGELWAVHDIKKIKKTFMQTEWLLHNIVVLVFGITYLLIIPFVQIYTLGTDDVNYVNKCFSTLIVLAYASYCLRIPYHFLIKAVGHYRQTQFGYIVSAIINIIISVIAVQAYGLPGVAAGTLVATVFQTFYMFWYSRKEILFRTIGSFAKQILTDTIIIFIGIFLSQRVHIIQLSYAYFGIMLLQEICIWGIVSFVINLIFYKDKIKDMVQWILK